MSWIRHFFILILFSLILSSCGKKKEESSASVSSSRPESTQQEGTAYPYLTYTDINSLHVLTDKADMLFYRSPISISQDDAASAKNTVLYISPNPPVITAKCEPMGRLTWISDGKIIREADFYVGEGCNYLVFMENNAPAYQNAMAPEGIEFYNTIMSQIKKKIVQ